MRAPQTFRKKPVEVQAMQFPVENDPPAAHAVYQWVEASTQGSYDFLGDKRPEHGVSIEPADGLMVICTLEGEMTVSPGDWVIRGVQGEFYPCKPDIFAATYDLVEVVQAGDPSPDEYDSDYLNKVQG